MIRALLVATLVLAASPALAARPAEVVEGSGFSGEIVVSRGDARVYEHIALQPDGKPASWRWASVTKQIVATLMLQEVAAGRIDLDRPVSTYLPRFKSPNASTITVRQLLRHQTGLPNPDDTAPVPDAPAAFYQARFPGSRDPLSGYCAGPAKGTAGGSWAYNNCDYMVAGALLQAVTGKSWQRLVRERIARPLKLASLGAFPTRSRTLRGTIAGKAEPEIALETFGASGALYGTISDLWTFDRALMTGRLLPEAQRREMWDGKPELGAIALGQWAFTVPLKGCTDPVRIVERRGAIGGVALRNFILPDLDIAVVAITDRGEFDYGEVWQGSGFSYALLSAAACSA